MMLNYHQGRDAMQYAKSIAALLICGASAFFSSVTLGFEINPCLRVLVYNPNYLDADSIRFWNACRWSSALKDIKNGKYFKGTVHEHMTNFSIDEYKGTGFLVTVAQRSASEKNRDLKFNFMAEKSWKKPGSASEHNTYAIMFGSWWNDDPLMYSWGQGRDFIGGLDSIKQQFDPKTHLYACGVAKCWLQAKDHLGWNSHYGTLQHLHFMTSQPARVGESVRVAETTRLALVWIKFAYSVATGDRKADSQLTTLDEKQLNLPSIALNYDLKDPANAKVRTLFARPQAGNAELRNIRTPDVALGSILHILQDSFSPAHTCRKEQYVDGEHFAVLTQVYNFNEQVHSVDGELDHSLNDRFPGWLLTYARNRQHVYGNDPILVGRWMIEAVDRKTEWKDVEGYLRATIFRQQSNVIGDNSACIGKRAVNPVI